MFAFSLLETFLCFDIHRSFKFASRERIVSHAFWKRLSRAWSLLDFIDRIILSDAWLFEYTL